MSIAETPQFHQGMEVEGWLDQFFAARGWHIRRATKREERTLHLGDRHMEREGRSLWIEYKSGLQTFYTGNVFLETISVDTTCAPGWVYSCQADLIVYAALLNHRLLYFKPEELRKRIAEMIERFPTLKTSKGQNATYKTHGVVVPLAIAERELACKVVSVDAGKIAA